MSMRQTEYPNNTREQVEHYLEQAALVVAGLDLPPELCPAAFLKAVDLLAAKQVVLEQVGLGMGIAGPNAH